MDWLAAPLDPAGGPTPEVITEVYVNPDTGVVGKRIEPNIGVVRKKQEELLLSVYGAEYQDDEALRRAVRIVDRINERVRKAQIRWGTHRDNDVKLAEYDTILQEESGLAYFTDKFTAQELMLNIYLQEVGDTLRTQYGTTTEYLRLHFTHPNESKERLLGRFRQSVQNGLILTKNPWQLW